MSQGIDVGLNTHQEKRAGKFIDASRIDSHAPCSLS